MIREYLLAKHLVMTERQSSRVTSRIGLLHQLQVTRHVLVKQCYPVEFFQQVKSHMRFIFDDGPANFSQVITDPEGMNMVAHFS